MAASETISSTELPRQVFDAGLKMLDTWEALDPTGRRELFPHLVFHMVYGMLGDDLEPEVFRDLASGLEERVATLDNHATTVEARRQPFVLRPEDYDY